MKVIAPVTLYFSLAVASVTGIAQSTLPDKLVTPGASPEAIELFDYLCSISGIKTLTGQHDQPIFKSAYYQRVYELTGKHPAVKGMDFGFSEPNTLDGINFRQQLVDEAIRYWQEGTIITLMWHAVPPTKEEPVTFHEDIQSRLTEEEWNELMTPDSKLNRRWQSQVDVIAFFLKQLRDAHVPIIWRPYHEMNGKWFWWGNKPGEKGYQQLYKMLFDRLVNYHKINNLIWVFDANEISGDWMSPYKDFYPGHNFVDILATDVYRNNFQQSDYDQLIELGEGKLIALGEVGKMPTAEILAQQPKWIWFMTWVESALYSNSGDELNAIYNAENTLTREEISIQK
jgi:mannan endo-1,4-beta-mannosidase